MRRLDSALFLLAVTPLLAQDNKDDIIKGLLARMEALEREVASLRTGAKIAPPAPAEVPSIALPVSEPEPPDTPRFAFHAYTDIGYARNAEGDSSKRYILGELDLFTTVRIAPKLTALVETVFETGSQAVNADVEVNIERLLLQYRQSDFLKVDLGSYRTAIGYYNRAILRGSWLQTALSRPRMFAYEDQGGFLPLHNTGVSLNGRIPSGPLGLRYISEAGNSRNYLQPRGLTQDFQYGAAYNVALYALPRRFPGMDIGVSAYRDKFIPLATAHLSRQVWTAHVVYQTNHLEFLNEGVFAKLRETSGSGHATIPAFYSQLAYSVRPSWKPYFRYEYINTNGVGSSAVARRFLPWRTVILSGVRYDINDSLALKFELARETNWFQSPWIRAGLQLAFTF